MNPINRVIGVEIETLQRESFGYFEHEVNSVNGLAIDKTASDSPASIAATGFALAAYPVGVESGFISRTAAVKRTLATLRFFWNSPQGPQPDATGYQGLYYHFLDMQTGRRAGGCELSTVDSAFLLAGMLTVAAYFDADTEDEKEIGTLADALYRRANWHWAQNKGVTLTHGWKPESGFLRYRWEGYDEGLLLYMLALGSPTYPLAGEGFAAWCSTYQWKSHYGYDFLYAGSFFTHQLSHIWIDFRDIQDDFMREKGIDYFENSRRATRVQQQYAVHNPLMFTGYGPSCWGITASDGPVPPPSRSTASSGSSLITSPVEYRLGLMMAPWRLGQSPPRCRLRRTSCCLRSSISFVTSSSKPTIPMASRRRSMPRIRQKPTILAAGCRHGTTGSIRDHSCS